MSLKAKKLLVCNCEGTMRLNGKAIAKACGTDAPLQVHSQLCRAQLDVFRAAVSGTAHR